METLSAFAHAVFTSIIWFLAFLQRQPWLIWQNLVRKYILQAPRAFYGFANAPNEDICHVITQVKSSHWAANPLECDEKIAEHVDSHAVFFAYLLGAMMFVQSLNLLPSLCLRQSRNVMYIQPPPLPPPAPLPLETNKKTSKTPEQRLQTNAKTQITQDLNKLNTRKVALYEAFFSHLILQFWDKPVGHALRSLPQEALDSPVVKLALARNPQYKSQFTPGTELTAAHIAPKPPLSLSDSNMSEDLDD